MAEFSRETIKRRVEELRTPFAQQAAALFRKNLAFQWKRRTTNCCLVLVPLLVLLLVFGAQALLEILFLGSSSVRCPYCGPAGDSWGQTYCNKASSCAQFFFPNSSRSDYEARPAGRARLCARACLCVRAARVAAAWHV